MTSPKKIAAIIPARYGSTRFPGKPLVDIAGKSMIQRVWEQTIKVFSVNEAYGLPGSDDSGYGLPGLDLQTIIATDDQRIADHAKSFGAEVIISSKECATGTERIADAVKQLSDQPDIVINVQGDEPFISPNQIEDLALFMLASDAEIATQYKIINSLDDLNNPNRVKVVSDQQNRAFYFSRQAIPHRSESGELSAEEAGIFKQHVGLYAYQTEVLFKIVELPESPLEKMESLEQLRWLENGYSILVQQTDYQSYSVDVPGDLLQLPINGTTAREI
ncbi:3-deoxy-manno-octulosonate cytidylyltransferase [Chitinophagales bacterium]|nr:3-deoxy-manno-octulosonate cytidylyltransferase [Chitinophagales bacterium]